MNRAGKYIPNSYHLGAHARKRRKPKSSVPHPAMTQDWAWWVAGWNDADRELYKAEDFH